MLKLVEKERDDYLEELRNARTQIVRLETNQLLSSLEASTLDKTPADKSESTKQEPPDGALETDVKVKEGTSVGSYHFSSD